jgi:hypothetical protein
MTAHAKVDPRAISKNREQSLKLRCASSKMGSTMTALFDYEHRCAEHEQEHE